MNSNQKKEYSRMTLMRRSSNIKSSSGLDGNIDNAESIDLTGNQLINMCNGKVKIVEYSDLANINSIEQLLQPYGAVILLYQIQANFGHYTALFYDRNNNLEFFDSYGFQPDQELKYAVYDKKANLTRLLNSYKGKVIINNTKLQQWASDVNTCGRWCATRIRMKNKIAPEFTQLFKNNKYFNPDWYVSAITYLYTYQ